MKPFPTQFICSPTVPFVRDGIVPHFNSPLAPRSKPLRAVQYLTTVICLAAILPFARAAITLTGPGPISLPQITVTDSAVSVYSSGNILELRNPNVKTGWILTGEVINGYIEGVATSAQLTAELTFVSITWVPGGLGSNLGLTIYPDGKTIEADPGFGRGTYHIEFEIRYDVPAFPRADTYQGLSTFIIQ